jgi:hypothetical protein
LRQKVDDDLAQKLREELEVRGVPWPQLLRKKPKLLGNSWNIQVGDQYGDWFKSEFSMMFPYLCGVKSFLIWDKKQKKDMLEYGPNFQRNQWLFI